MKPRTRRMIIIALILCMAPPAWGQQFLLYSPQPVSSGQKAPSQDGILVREIEIRKGDTLYALSRKFSGHGMYFPQILLFNSIKNPNLIYSGHILRIPVSQKEAHGSDRINTKPTGASPRPKASGNKTSSRPAAGVPAADASAGQKLYEAAVKAYRQDDCRTALELLDRYLADNSGSPLAADANLYKAECYLKLSAQ